MMFAWFWTVSAQTWLALAVGLGLSLITIGWRGRLIDRAPRCRRCRYILAELPTPVCPECGLDSARCAPRRGLRQIRLAPLLSGSLVILCLTSALAHWWSNRAALVQVAPNALLLAASDLGDREAFVTLYRRFDGHAPAESYLARGLARRALAARDSLPPPHGDLEIWSSIMRALDLHDQLTDAEWTRYVLQSVRDAHFAVRPACRVSEPLPFHLVPLTVMPSRDEYTWTIRVSFLRSSRSPAEEVATLEVKVPPQSRGSIAIGGGPSSGAFPLPVGVGSYTLRIELLGTFSSGYSIEQSFPPSVRARVKDHFRKHPIDEAWLDGDYIVGYSALTERARSLAPAPPVLRFLKFCDIRVVPPDSDDDLAPINGPDVRQTLENALCLFTDYGSPASPTRREAYPLAQLRISPLGAMPGPIAYDVFVRQGALERHWITIRGANFEWDRRIEYFDTAPTGFVDGPTVFSLRRSAAIDRSTLDNRIVDEPLTLGPFLVDFP